MQMPKAVHLQHEPPLPPPREVPLTLEIESDEDEVADQAPESPSREDPRFRMLKHGWSDVEGLIWMKKLAVESLKQGGIYVGVVETLERDAQAVEWMREVVEEGKQKDMETGNVLFGVGCEVLTQMWGVQQCAFVETQVETQMDAQMDTHVETQVETQVEMQMESHREMEGAGQHGEMQHEMQHEMHHGGLVQQHKRQVEGGGQHGVVQHEMQHGGLVQQHKRRKMSYRRMNAGYF